MSEQLIAELRGILLQIALKSHAPTANANVVLKGDDVPKEPERWRTRASQPIVPHLGAHGSRSGSSSTPRGGVSPRDDREAEAEEYWLKSAEYFQHKLNRILRRSESTREILIRELLVEAEETLRRWRRSPLDLDRPESMKDPKWGLFIAVSKEDAGTLARWYGCSRQHIYATRKKWREA